MASFYKFKKNLKFKALLESAFDLVAGHDHDGSNSKAVSGGNLAAGTVTLEKLAATAKTHVLSIQVPDLDAGADITTRAAFEVPAGLTATVTDARIIMQGAAAGVDDANTCVISILNGANAIATATYNTATAMPDENASGSLGALDAAKKVLAAGSKLHYTVTNGATANPPAMVLQVAYTLATAA